MAEFRLIQKCFDKVIYKLHTLSLLAHCISVKNEIKNDREQKFPVIFIYEILADLLNFKLASARAVSIRAAAG